MKILGEIKSDFPDVVEVPGMKIEGDSSADEGMPSVNKKIEWSCFICTTHNSADASTCMACAAPRDHRETLKK